MIPPIPTSIRMLIITLLAILLSACQINSAKHLANTHRNYNQAVTYALNQEIFNNVIREHFNEPISFLSISSINTSGSAPSATASLSQDGFSGTDILSLLSGSLSSSTGSHSTSISFTPTTGAQYAEELLRPIDIKNIAYIGYAQSNLTNILRVSIQKIGPWENSAKKTPQAIKQRQNCINFIDMIQHIFRDNGHILHINPVLNKTGKSTGHYILSVDIPASFTFSKKQQELLTQLDLPTNIKQIKLSDIKIANTVLIYPRSLIGTNRFLSDLITAAPIDDDSITRERYDTHQAIVNIYTSEAKPNNAYLSTYSHGQWYYTLNNDENSKFAIETLILLYDVSRTTPTATSSFLINT